MRPDCATRSYPPTPRPASGGRPWRAKGWRRSCLPGWRVSQGPYRRDRGAGLCSFLLPFEFLSGSCWLMVRVEVKLLNDEIVAAVPHLLKVAIEGSGLASTFCDRDLIVLVACRRHG